MLFLYEKREDLRNNIKKPQLKRLLTQCEFYFSYGLPATQPPMSITFMGAAIANLAFAYVLTEEKKYLDQCWRWMNTVIGYPDWGYIKLVNVDLSASWVMFGLSLAYDWIGNALTIEQKKLLTEKLLRHAGIMYDFFLHKSSQDKNDGWAGYYFQNHNWINMCALGTVGLALKDVTSESKNWIEASLKNFDLVFTLMPEDGSDYEGVPYWRYGAAWLYYAAHLYKTANLRDYFRDSQFLQNSFNYRIGQALPNLAEIATFGDCHDFRSGHNCALYYLIAREYRNGYSQMLGNIVLEEFFDDEAKSGVKPGIKPEAYMEYIFYDHSVEPKPLNELSRTYFTDDMGVCSVRSSWDRNATFFSFKSSFLGGKKQWKYVMERYKKDGSINFSLTHQHPDNNSFILWSNGEYLITDDGFNRTKHASDHSVILVDNIGYPVEGGLDLLRDSAFKTEKEGYDPQAYTAEITYFKDYGHVQVTAGEAANVYEKSLKLTKNERVCVLINTNIIFIIDNLESDLPHAYTWQIHTPKQGIVSSKKSSVPHYVFKNEQAYFNLFSLHNDSIVTNRHNYVKAVMTPQEPNIFHETHSEVHMDTNCNPMQKYQFRHILSVNKEVDFTVTNDGKTVLFSDEGAEYVMRFVNDSEYDFTGSFLLTEKSTSGLKIYTDSSFFCKNA